MKFDEWWREWEESIKIATPKQLRMVFKDAYNEGYEQGYERCYQEIAQDNKPNQPKYNQFELTAKSIRGKSA